MTHLTTEEWIESAGVKKLREFVQTHCEQYVSPQEAVGLSLIIMQSFRLHVEAAPLVLRDRAGAWHVFEKAEGQATKYVQRARVVCMQTLDVKPLRCLR